MLKGIVCALVASICTFAIGGEPNPPKWPNTVSVFSPGQSGIQARINQIFKLNGGHIPAEHGQFSPYRFAMMFKPGTYSVDVPLGYYTTIHGLGESPSQVIFNGPKGVFCEEGDYQAFPGALDNFWRSAEGFTSTSNYAWFSGDEGTGMMWAASQAAPLRRVIVQHSLLLFEYVSPQLIAGMASGGYMGNVKVGGQINMGSQQQFIFRNVEAAGFKDGVWNMVFVGTEGAPPAHCGHPPNTAVHPIIVVPETPVIAEMPFITIDGSGKYYLQVPALKKNSKGVEHGPAATKIPFDQVYVSQLTDSAQLLNSKLQAGLHLVISPGVYNLTAPLVITKPKQIIFGLGIATLVSSSGNILIDIPSGMDGVRICQLLLQAGPQPTEVLLRVGSPSERDAGNAADPIVISDVFARVGGPDESQVQAKKMVQINTGNVIVDDTWLWRADHGRHGRLIKNRENPCTTGFEVKGDDVTAYGLAVEHTLGDLVNWAGNGGEVYMFQSEYPYDVTQAQYGDPGFVAYRVGSSVTSHKGYGIGVYHFFRDYTVTVKTGISCPASLESSFIDPLGVYLNGTGTMLHILNDKGVTTSHTAPTSDPGAHPAWIC